MKYFLMMGLCWHGIIAEIKTGSAMIAHGSLMHMGSKGCTTVAQTVGK